MSIPFFGLPASAILLLVYTTLTVPGGSTFAVLSKSEVNSFVNKNNVTLFVPSCSS